MTLPPSGTSPRNDLLELLVEAGPLMSFNGLHVLAQVKAVTRWRSWRPPPLRDRTGDELATSTPDSLNRTHL